VATHLKTIETAEAVPQPELCLNCGADLNGEYCHRCGQKKIHRHEFAVKHFFGHILHEFTHLDSNKILRTLTDLVFKPGLLTAEYLAGRKGRYINPIRVYLTFSALYFLFAWGALLEFRGGGLRDAYRQPRIVAMAQKKGVEPQAYIDKIYQKAEKYSAILRFTSVLMSGLFLTILYYGMKRYYVEHLVFSLYFYSFDFCCKTLFALLIIISGAGGLKLPTRTLDLFYPVAFIYLIFALRRVYKESWSKTLLKSVVLFVCETALFFAVNIIGFMIAFSMA
jgi:Protein of unknown function (DUF3667)